MRSRDLLACGGDPLLVLSRQPFEELGRERLPVGERCRHDADGRDLECKASLAGERLQLLGQVGLPLLHVGKDGASSLVVLVALERARDLPTRGTDELGHLLRERASSTGGQADRIRPVGLAEVVHVHPVLGRRARGGEALERVPHDRGASRAGHPGDEEVVAGGFDLEPELDRVDCPRLADHLRQRLDVRRRAERQRARVDVPAKPRRPELEPRCGRTRPPPLRFSHRRRLHTTIMVAGDVRAISAPAESLCGQAAAAPTDTCRCGAENRLESSAGPRHAGTSQVVSA